MYFVEHDDLQLIARRLGPQARNQPVAEDLRGWRWYRPPLSPVYDAPLSVGEVAGAVCPTGRDVYLTHVLDVRPRPSAAEIEETALRATAALAVVEAKRALYMHGAEAARVVAGSEPPALGMVMGAEAPAPAGLAERVAELWRWECSRLSARIGEVMAAQPGAGVDTLVALATPVMVGRRVDGRFLGLTERLEADGVLGPAVVVVALRFGPPRPADRLLTTGMALALEAAHDTAVDLGCVVYGGFEQGRLTVRREVHVIDDEVRQQFIEARDEKGRVVQEEIDPGLPGQCPSACGWWAGCHADGR